MRSMAIRALATAIVLGAPTTPARAETLTVASWNLALPASPAGKSAATAPYARLAPIVGKLDAHIVAVQGVDRATIEHIFGTDAFVIEAGGTAPLQTALLIDKKLSYVRRSDYREADSETGETRAGTWIDLTIAGKRIAVMSAATGVTCGRAVITGDGRLQDRCDRLDLAVRNTEGWLRGRPGGLSKPYIVLGTVAAVPPPDPATAGSDGKDPATTGSGGKDPAAAGSGAKADAATTSGGTPSGTAGTGTRPAKPVQLPDFILRAEALKRQEEARRHVEPGCTSSGPGATLEYVVAGPTARGWAQPATFQQLFFPGDKDLGAKPGFDTGGTLSDQCPILLTFDIR